MNKNLNFPTNQRKTGEKSIILRILAENVKKNQNSSSLSPQNSNSKPDLA